MKAAFWKNWRGYVKTAKKDEVIILGYANAQIEKETCLREMVGNDKQEN